MMKVDKEIVVALIGIIGILLSAFLGAFLYKGKLRREQKARMKTMTGETIFSSLNVYKDVIKELNTISDAIPEEIYEDEKYDSFERQAYTSTILKNRDSLSQFCKKIKVLRHENFDNLGLDSAATLYCLERYFINLEAYSRHLHDEQIPLVGTIILRDFQVFYTQINSIINGELNKTRVKFAKHIGFFWEFKKKKYRKLLWDKSLLLALINPEKSTLPEDQKGLATLMGLALKSGVVMTNAPSFDGTPNDHVGEIQKVLNESEK